MVGVGVTKRKTSLKVGTDAPEHATHVPFGTSVTFSVQVVDSNDDPVAEKGIAVTLMTNETDTDKNKRSATQTHKTDASGRVEITRSYDDPDEDDESADVDSYRDSDGRRCRSCYPQMTPIRRIWTSRCRWSDR